MDVGCIQQWFTASMMISQCHLGSTSPQFSKILPTCTGISVRVHPYAHPQHIKALKYIVYIQYGCGI